MSLFKGCATALITPFDENGIDFDAYGRLIDFQIENGVNALVVTGTTGEPATMTAEERKSVISFAIEKTAKRVPVIVGSGSNNTATAVSQSQDAEKAGADGLLVVTPYYNKCTQNGLIAHYNAVADSVNIPLIAYNVPGRTGVNILPSTFAQIARHKNVVAIKEACGNMEQIAETTLLSKGYADVISGDDALVVPIMSLGGTGVISVASNIAPKYVGDITAKFLSGDVATAGQMQLDILPLVKALFSEVNPIPVKFGASLLGFGKNILRLPLTPVSDENGAKLKRLMQSMNLL